MYVSRTREIVVRLNSANHIMGVWERPLSWVHATLVGARQLRAGVSDKAQGLIRVHDCRIKVLRG